LHAVRLALTTQADGGGGASVKQSLAFTREAEMTDWVVAGVGNLAGRAKPDFVAAEVQGAVGIIDLVAARFEWESVENRLFCGKGPVLNPNRVRALVATPRGSVIRTSTLARRLNTRKEALLRSTLGPLLEQGYLDMSGDRVRRSGAWDPIVRSLTAIELKRNNWRGALRQADNAQISADKAWVVLDHLRVRPAQASGRLFAEFGVGLASVDHIGQIHVHVRPRRAQSNPWFRAWMGELVWAKWLQESLPGV
jgi:hypothetical protein